MPSTATITAMYTFVANTRAKAAEVNQNFNIFRGHLIPVEPLTQTSSHLTYDLGSSDHAWRVGYMQKLNIRSATTTAAFIIQGNTLVTAGAADFLFDTTTIASWDVNGMKRQGLESAANRMTTSAFGTGLLVVGINTIAAFDVTNMSVTIDVKKSLVEIDLVDDNTVSAGQIGFEATVGSIVAAYMRVVRDTVTSIVNGANSSKYFENLVTNSAMYLQASALRWIDDPGAGSHTYKLQVYGGAANGVNATFRYLKLRVREL